MSCTESSRLLRTDELSPVQSTAFVEAPLAGEKWVTGGDGHVYGKIVSTATQPDDDAVCWYCTQSRDRDDLYKPCQCASLIHRTCLRKWRTGWINPKNYFSCPNCMFSYNMERVRPATTDSVERMRRNYRIGLVKIWATCVLLYVACVGAFAGISYGSDTSDKNIPVAMRYILTSVVGGFPNSNSTAEWRASFHQPDVRVWPYYSMFGIFLTSVVILTVFAFMGCTFNEEDRRRSGHCSCCDDCCSSGANNGLYVWYAPTPSNGGCCNCLFDCGSCRLQGCCGGDEGCGCDKGEGGGGGGCGGGGGGGGGGEAILIIIVVIVVIIIFSALFVAVIFTVQKCSLLYDRLTAMLDSQQRELEGETVVLGIHESWRPNNAV